MVSGGDLDELVDSHNSITDTLVFVCSHQPLTHLSLDKMAAISQTTFFKWISFNEKVWISIKISLNFVPKGLINSITAMVQIMAWRRPGDKPLSELMLSQFTDAYMQHKGEMS